MAATIDNESKYYNRAGKGKKEDLLVLIGP